MTKTICRTPEDLWSTPHVIAEEGTALSQKPVLDFRGDGVEVDDQHDRTIVNISSVGPMGPQGPQGPKGDTGSEASLSTDAGNRSIIGSDGGVFTPELNAGEF